MTTAHKPTYHPAVGSAHQGGYRYHAPRKQFSARDIAAHTKLKTRQVGQGAPQELAIRNMKEELEERERKHHEEKLTEQRRAGLLPYAEAADPNKQMQQIDMSQFDDSDDSDSDGAEDSDDSEGDDDEEAELLRELEKIKQEREEEKKRKEEEELAALEAQNQEAVLRGNPLLAHELTGDSSFAVKRRWDDDVPFKNQARDVVKVKKQFINDTIRSPFHRQFLNKYIK